jgi:C1A family cysteine protease
MNTRSQTNLVSRNRLYPKDSLTLNQSFPISAELVPLDDESIYSLRQVVSTVSGDDSQESFPTLKGINLAVSDAKATVNGEQSSEKSPLTNYLTPSSVFSKANILEANASAQSVAVNTVTSLADSPNLIATLLQSRPLVIRPYAITDFGNPIVSTSQGSLAAPISYDLRTLGLVTSVKNQGNCGSCWAFGSYASLESSILKVGGGSRDFSENHLKNYHGFDWGPCDGGNDLMSLAYLSRGSGSVNEKDDPYHDYDDRPSPGGIPRYYVGQTLWFDTDTEIKNALMDKGALTTSMYWNNSYFNDATDTYYYSGSQYTNHCVSIVGWDDNKVVSGTAVKGAWLIKNSWGTSWGNGGYFWISYADSQGANRGVCFSQATSPYKNIYNYDQLGAVTSWNTPYAFNAYTAQKNEPLKAIGFYTLADSASYEIKIYDDFQGDKLTNLLSSVTGTQAFQGYHTVQLPKVVSLKGGDKFYVSLHLTNGGQYPMAGDERWGGYSSACTANPGESYWSFDGNTWSDLNPYSSTANFSIKALVGSSSTTKTISIAKTAYGKEASLASTVFTLTRSNTTGSLTVNYTLSGTATRGSDYTGGGSGKVRFAAGANKATITLPTKDDLLGDPSETIIATITAPTGYTISGSASVTAMIADNDGTYGNDNLTGTNRANALAGLAGNDTLAGLSGNDTLDGGSGNDILVGGRGKDVLIGGSEQDTHKYNALKESILSGFDVIKGYGDAGTIGDLIDAPTTVQAITLTASKGKATGLTEAAIQAVLTSAKFGANTAAAFKVTGQSGTFIALNNGVAGFLAATDSIIQLANYNIGASTSAVII